MNFEAVGTEIVSFILNIGFLPWLLIVYILSSYIFWAESKKVQKDRSSIFDQWFVSTLVMIFWGRISYIIANWQEFALLQWFYSPYERYGDKVFWFRLLPWKFFAVWDGGFLFTGLIAAFVLISFYYITIVKKWSWVEMLRPVISASEFMLGAILFFYGIFIESSEVMLFGVFLLIGVLIFYILHLIMSKFFKQDSSRESRILLYGNSVYLLISFLFIAFLFLQGELTMIDKINIGILLLSGIATVGLYYTESVRPVMKIESYSIVRPVQLASLTNRAIKVDRTKNE